MSKRPAESLIETSAKKACVNPYSYESLCNTLESLRETADKHHEEARIAAIDTASTAEEEWTHACVEKDRLEALCEEIEEAAKAATAYLDTFKESDTVKMLKKADSEKVVDKLVEDNEKITDTLTKLDNLCGRMRVEFINHRVELDEKIKHCEELKICLDAAEKRVETITNLNV